MEKRIEVLEKKIDLIINKLDSIETNTDKMDKHIDFVEGVYETLKRPLQFITTKLSGFNSTLPTLTSGIVNQDETTDN